MRWLRKGRFRFFREQSGFSLIEVLVAVVLLGVIGSSVLLAIDTNTRASRTVDEQVVAMNLATTYLEAIKESAYAEDYPIDAPPLNSITVPSDYEVYIRTQFSVDGNEWYDDYDNETIQKITISISRKGSGKPVLSICAFKAKFL